MPIIFSNIKYVPEIEAANAQGIPMSHIFARVEECPDGLYVAYPLARESQGEIPIDEEGDIVYNADRVHSAKSLAALHHESDVSAKIHELTDGQDMDHFDDDVED